jgi:hypothetical protein
MIKVFSINAKQKEPVAIFNSGEFITDIEPLLNSFLPKSDADYVRKNVAYVFGEKEKFNYTGGQFNSLLKTFVINDINAYMERYGYYKITFAPDKE